MSIDPYSSPKADPSPVHPNRDPGPSWIRIALLSGIPFGLFMAFGLGITGPNHLDRIKIGLACGLFFGLFMGPFARRQILRAQANPPDTAGEPSVFEGAVSYATRVNNSKVGYLILTRQRLLFRGTKAKPGEPDLSANLKDISAVWVSKYLGLIPNRLQLKFHSGKSERFVVHNHRHWLAAFAQAREGVTNGEPQD